MSALPQTINLRVTRAALNQVPSAVGRENDPTLKLNYTDNNQCLICQSVRRQFRYSGNIEVVPGQIEFAGQSFWYSTYKFEDRIEAAHRHPDKFKPFILPLTRRN